MRPALVALFALDIELWRVPVAIREPLAAELRLAWWRDALQALDGAPPPPQPILVALAAHALPTLGGGALAALEDGALARLHQDAAAPRIRADILFALAARLLGAPAPPGLGRAWAAGEEARRGEAAQSAPPPPPAPAALRPLLALDRLGARDLRRTAAEPRGSPARQILIARTMLLG